MAKKNPNANLLKSLTGRMQWDIERRANIGAKDRRNQSPVDRMHLRADRLFIRYQDGQRAMFTDFTKDLTPSVRNNNFIGYCVSGDAFDGVLS